MKIKWGVWGAEGKNRKKKITWICGMEAKVLLWVLKTFIQNFKDSWEKQV